MEIKTAMAGTLESGDIFIQIAPNDNAGLHIDLESTVAYQFGDQIKTPRPCRAWASTKPR